MVVLNRDRYVVYQLYTEGLKIELSELKSEIWFKYKTLYGIMGTTDAGLFFISYDKQEGIGLVRCTSNSLAPLMSTLALIKQIKDNKVTIIPLFVSGTIKKAKKYITEKTSTSF